MNCRWKQLEQYKPERKSIMLLNNYLSPALSQTIQGIICWFNLFSQCSEFAPLHKIQDGPLSSNHVR